MSPKEEKKKETLLEKAIKIQNINRKAHQRVVATDEHFELIMAWAREEISYLQLSSVTGLPVRSGNILYYVAQVFKQGVQAGKFKYKK